MEPKREGESRRTLIEAHPVFSAKPRARLAVSECASRSRASKSSAKNLLSPLMPRLVGITNFAITIRGRPMQQVFMCAGNTVLLRVGSPRMHLRSQGSQTALQAHLPRGSLRPTAEPRLVESRSGMANIGSEARQKEINTGSIGNSA